MVPKKRIRGKRTRLRQRERRGENLRSRYRQDDLPAIADIGVVTIEDPYSEPGRVDKAGNIHVEAQLETVRHRDDTLAEGAPAWTPASRPLIEVIVSLRQDPFGRMYARHKISEPQFRAGRIYQETYEQANVGRMSPADPGRIKVDGGRIVDPISPVRMLAAKRLRSVERTLRENLGDLGLALCRAVLVECRSIEAAARGFGAEGKDLKAWGWLFRKCLDCLCRALGLANSSEGRRGCCGLTAAMALPI
jgi:hypothetical protein